MLMKLLIFDFNITKFFKFFPFLCMLSKIYVFSKFIIFHFFSYFSGNNLESLKKLFTFQEIKPFYLILKKLPFCFQENLRIFHFFLFLFLYVFVSSDVFIVDCICSLHFFFTLFVRYFVFVLLPRMLRISGRVFYLTLLPAFIKASWRWQFCLEDCRFKTEVPLRFKTQTQSICLFESYIVRKQYDKQGTLYKLVKTC